MIGPVLELITAWQTSKATDLWQEGWGTDLIFLSSFLYFSFTTPSGLRRKRKICCCVTHGLINYQITVINSFISFSELKFCDEFIKQQHLGFGVRTNDSKLRNYMIIQSIQKVTYEVASELKRPQSHQFADGSFTHNTCLMDNIILWKELVIFR